MPAGPLRGGPWHATLACSEVHFVVVRLKGDTGVLSPLQEEVCQLGADLQALPPAAALPLQLTLQAQLHSGSHEEGAKRPLRP